MTDEKTSARWRVAAHEAGHAVAARLVFGASPVARIWPSGDGICVGTNGPRDFALRIDEGTAIAKRKAVIDCAGWAAEEFFWDPPEDIPAVTVAHQPTDDAAATSAVEREDRERFIAGESDQEMFIRCCSFLAKRTYTNASGAEVMRVARFNLPDGSKEFRPVHSTDAGWKIGDPPGPLPLYRLNEIPQVATVWATEGEKACDAAAGLGLAAVTSAHGSSAPDKTDWTPLAGREVVILPDHDEPGRKYARAVAMILAKLVPPARVKVVELPELPDGGDVVEYIDARDSMDTEAIAGSIVALADAAPFINATDLIGGPVVTRLSDVRKEPIKWLWLGRLALRKAVLWVGAPGDGKGTVAADITARVSTGGPMPDGSPGMLGDVLLIASEDGLRHRARIT